MARSFDLEKDLKRCKKIKEKVQDYKYAQSLYAALCNTEWVKFEVMQLLKNEGYSCSWRYAGGIVSQIRGSNDYMEFYCSGIDDYAVPEGIVTNEVKDDLKELGWVLKD